MLTTSTGDLIGRRLAFNLTLLFAGVFGTAAGAANSFVSCAVLVSFCGFGVGGNLPVDSAVFLEFLPGTHQYLLEVLAVWWSFGQFIPAGAAWGFLSHFSCSEDTPAGQCQKKDNMGWRYLFYSMGALTLLAFFLRFFVFRLRESPRYLIGQGRYQEAIDVLNDVAKYNGTTQPLTVEDLLQVERDYASTGHPAAVDRPTAWQRTLAQFRPGGFTHIRALFSTRKVAYSTSLIILVWGMIGLASPVSLSAIFVVSTAEAPFSRPLALPGALPSILTWPSALCEFPPRIPRPPRSPGWIQQYCHHLPEQLYHHRLLHSWHADSGMDRRLALYRQKRHPRFGSNPYRRLPIRIHGSQNTGYDSGFQLHHLLRVVYVSLKPTPAPPFWGEFFPPPTSSHPSRILSPPFSDLLRSMWGALYLYTPEVIPSIHRGTGCGLASAFNRICGLQAPIIATYVGYNNKPIFISASMYIAAGFISFLFPYETAGKASI
jgi:MFS family permease